MQGVHHYEDFEAIHNHMPGSSRTLRVRGTVVFRTGGWSCDLRPAEGNPGINPLMLSLELVLTPPPDGAGETDVLTPCPVEWSVEDPEIDYTQVQFRLDGEDPPPPVIDVQHPV